MNYNLITILLLIILTACSSNTRKKNDNNLTEIKLEKYLGYSKDNVFDKKKILEDLSGKWICYHYIEDGENYPNFDRDKKGADEFKKYFYFEIASDSIVSSIYKMPIEIQVIDKNSLNNFAQATIKNIAKDSLYQSINPIYKIQGKKGMYYSSYCKLLIEQGITIPYAEDIPLGGSIWYFPDYLVIDNYGYYWYFKKGLPNNKGLTGMPSNEMSRFTVKRTYANCTIENAVYKLIEDFPKGTMGLLAFSDEPNEKGEMETWFPKKSGFNYGESTEYIWHNKNSVTARVNKHKNSTFVFEFVKKGDDVHVKYWNDVVFPFEDGYRYEGY